jgi:asparagine synthase (glutamine-hydrolysing)
MCGIAGVLRINKSVSISELKRMTDIISHRGPDGEGHWINEKGNIGLGHRRLSIIDLSNHASQPMHLMDERYSITFNGEIYNYLELKKELENQGIQFRTNSDTEVLLALYALKGASCLSLLDGMFSFAIWDNEEQKLFCARDRFGEKPFHYSLSPNNYFVFGSEIKQLFSFGIEKSTNQNILYNFLNNNSIQHDPREPEKTFYKNIERLEPAHYLVVDQHLNVVKTRYWDLNMDFENTSISMNEATEQLYSLMQQSVKLRLRSDVPVGSSLSGGLDSSTIVCLIDQLNLSKTIKQKTFSARFNNFEKDEGKFMQMVIDSTHVEPHFTYPDETVFIEDFEKICYHQEEPFGGASIFAQWEVMKLAKQQNVTVLLDGQGADESLAGYHFYFHTYLNELKRNNSSLYERELGAYRNRYNPNFGMELPNQMKNSTQENYIKQIARSAYRTIIPRKVAEIGGRSDDFLNKDFVKNFEQNSLLNSSHEGSLKEQLYVNNCVIGLNNLLRFADRNSMAFSREMRLPFLSHHLVEFLFSLPSDFKIHHGWSKYIMRLAFEPILPKEITWRSDKIGYEPPQKKWMLSPKVKELVYSSISELEKQGIVNKKRKKIGNIDEWNALVVSKTLFP